MSPRQNSVVSSSPGHLSTTRERSLVAERCANSKGTRFGRVTPLLGVAFNAVVGSMSLISEEIKIPQRFMDPTLRSIPIPIHCPEEKVEERLLVVLLQILVDFHWPSGSGGRLTAQERYTQKVFSRPTYAVILRLKSAACTRHGRLTIIRGQNKVKDEI
ncbi:hypothetical protein DM02DRAFT_652547 [Periconia macrospinosa]|uniref:Uncharacterized protein n=1 Tax=Periconia macrospinosa TaxID=97972 RepID=A0A2V1DYH8_9PLEO|nr:hypothetical protein DM02DRAFT_652547 [Periconia macrospinosa]